MVSVMLCPLVDPRVYLSMLGSKHENSIPCVATCSLSLCIGRPGLFNGNVKGSEMHKCADGCHCVESAGKCRPSNHDGVDSQIYCVQGLALCGRLEMGMFLKCLRDRVMRCPF